MPLTQADQHVNAAVEHGERGNFQAATNELGAALYLEPKHPKALAMMGWISTYNGNPQMGLHYADESLKEAPFEFFTHAIRADALMRLNHPELALDGYNLFLEVDDKNPFVWNNKGAALHQLGRNEEAIEIFKKVADMAPERADLCSSWVSTLDYCNPTVSHAQEVRSEWYQRYRVETLKVVPDDLGSEKKLNIGWVSPDFKNHATASISFPLIAGKPKDFDAYLYGSVAKPDEWTMEFAKYGNYRDISKATDQEVIDQIIKDKIDILVDLGCHTSESRMTIFCHKPAPIQVTGWGTGSGTGIKTIDYLFNDPVGIPERERHLYAEKIWDLPCHMTFWPPPGNPKPDTTLPYRRNGYWTFGHLGRYAKVSPEVEETWAEILKVVPESKLILKSSAFDAIPYRERIVKRWEELGIDAKRLDIRGTTSRGHHVEVHSEIDICLDTWPMSGGVTTLEAIHQGVPVLTNGGGHNFGSRASAAIMIALDLPGWVATDRTTYVWLAWSRTRNPEYMAELRKTLQDRYLSSPMGWPNYIPAVYKAFREMWHKYLEGRA